MNRKFYITTSIAYTNAPPHLGFALELVQADTVARYRRISGQDVFFLTGTDEHGAKVVKAAALAGKGPEEFCDEISGEFRQLARALGASNGDFIRTTDQKKHWPAVQKVWRKLKENGDLYKKNYEGLYCSGCEAFITEKDLEEGKCKIHQREPERINEENYFFRLSKYSKKIETLIEKAKIRVVPESRKNEILNFVKQGLDDISFSRPRQDLKWGIPVPDDESQAIYVWADALTNYLSAIGYADSDSPKYWPADIHFIGKDILKFHAAIWPGMLLSLEMPLPKTIFVHGFITVGGQKMSKSLGNVIDPFELVNKYGADAVRYFLLREIPPSEDGDFTTEKFEKRYNSDLAGGLGNLVARVTTLAKNFNVPPIGKFSNSKFPKLIKEAEKDRDSLLMEFRFNEALVKIWELISECDRYINEQKPWQESKKQKEVIGDLLLAISRIAKLLEPFFPETSGKIIKQFGAGKSNPLFPRV
ncbi:MAG: methionine--tRNA ligase [Candidatus Nealsonbacteria bacterium]|nr:methionine--tRNA ligase [Candidatus Nealsonbacteria bacterium]